MFLANDTFTGLIGPVALMHRRTTDDLFFLVFGGERCPPRLLCASLPCPEKIKDITEDTVIPKGDGFDDDGNDLSRITYQAS